MLVAVLVFALIELFYVAAILSIVFVALAIMYTIYMILNIMCKYWKVTLLVIGSLWLLGVMQSLLSL